MSSRESMLDRIRSAVAQGAPTDGAPAPIPRDYARTGVRARGSEAVLELLVDRLVDYQAEVERVDAAELAAAVARVIGAATSVVVPPGLPADIRSGADASGARIVVDGDPEPLSPAELDAIDLVITAARVAIAVTGTIILDAANDQGRRAITLVPDRHLVVLRADQVVETVPEGLAVLDPTAALTMISGPSATSDIELSRVEGVHGPRTLQVLIVR